MKSMEELARLEEELFARYYALDEKSTASDERAVLEKIAIVQAAMMSLVNNPEKAA